MLDGDRVAGMPSYAQSSNGKVKTTPRVLVISAAVNSVRPETAAY